MVGDLALVRCLPNVCLCAAVSVVLLLLLYGWSSLVVSDSTTTTTTTAPSIESVDALLSLEAAHSDSSTKVPPRAATGDMKLFAAFQQLLARQSTPAETDTGRTLQLLADDLLRRDKERKNVARVQHSGWCGSVCCGTAVLPRSSVCGHIEAPCHDGRCDSGAVVQQSSTTAPLGADEYCVQWLQGVGLTSGCANATRPKGACQLRHLSGPLDGLLHVPAYGRRTSYIVNHSECNFVYFSDYEATNFLVDVFRSGGPVVISGDSMMRSIFAALVQVVRRGAFSIVSKMPAQGDVSSAPTILPLIDRSVHHDMSYTLYATHDELVLHDSEDPLNGIKPNEERFGSHPRCWYERTSMRATHEEIPRLVMHYVFNPYQQTSRKAVYKWLKPSLFVQSFMYWWYSYDIGEAERFFASFNDTIAALTTATDTKHPPPHVTYVHLTVPSRGMRESRIAQEAFKARNHRIVSWVQTISRKRHQLSRSNSSVSDFVAAVVDMKAIADALTHSGALRSDPLHFACTASPVHPAGVKELKGNRRGCWDPVTAATIQWILRTAQAAMPQRRAQR